MYYFYILIGPRTQCSIIHPTTSCLNQIMYKCKHVFKVSLKLYGLLYLVMFIIQCRKIHRQHKYKKVIINWSRDYLWSLGFMAWFVGTIKGSLCLLNYFNSPLDGTPYFIIHRKNNTTYQFTNNPIDVLSIKIKKNLSRTFYICKSLQISIHILKKTI